PTGTTYDVAATTGYFRTTSADGKGLQRTYSSMDVLTYLTGNTADFSAPTFTHVTTDLHDGSLSVSAQITDDQGGAAGVKRVYLLALGDPAAGIQTVWRGIDLVRNPGSDTWTGSIPNAGHYLEYVVQGVD